MKCFKNDHVCLFGLASSHAGCSGLPTIYQSIPSRHYQQTQNICTTSTQRIRRWSNILQKLYEYFVFIGLPSVKPEVRETAYFSLVRSSLEYSSAVRDPIIQKDIDKSEKIRRAAARFVTQNYRQTASVTYLYSERGLD